MDTSAKTSGKKVSAIVCIDNQGYVFCLPFDSDLAFNGCPGRYAARRMFLFVLASSKLQPLLLAEYCCIVSMVNITTFP